MSNCHTRRSGYPMAESHRHLTDNGKPCPPAWQSDHKVFNGWYDDFMSSRPCFDDKFAAMKKFLDRVNWSCGKMEPLAANSFKPPTIIVTNNCEYRAQYCIEKKNPSEFDYLFRRRSKADDPPAVGIVPGVYPVKYEPVPVLFK